VWLAGIKELMYRLWVGVDIFATLVEPRLRLLMVKHESTALWGNLFPPDVSPRPADCATLNVFFLFRFFYFFVPTRGLLFFCCLLVSVTSFPSCVSFFSCTPLNLSFIYFLLYPTSRRKGGGAVLCA